MPCVAGSAYILPTNFVNPQQRLSIVAVLFGGQNGQLVERVRLVPKKFSRGAKKAKQALDKILIIVLQ